MDLCEEKRVTRPYQPFQPIPEVRPEPTEEDVQPPAEVADAADASKGSVVAESTEVPVPNVGPENAGPEVRLLGAEDSVARGSDLPKAGGKSKGRKRRRRGARKPEGSGQAPKVGQEKATEASADASGNDGAAKKKPRRRRRRRKKP